MDVAPLASIAAAASHVREYWSGPVNRVDVSTLDELTFLREYVLPCRPVILQGAADDWPALTRWQGAAGLLRFVAAGGADALVTLNVTPGGRGDAVALDSLGEEVFVKPLEVRTTFEAAVAAIATHARHCCTHTQFGSAGDEASGSRVADEASGSRVADEAVVSRSIVEARERTIASTPSALPPCGVPYFSAQDDNMRRTLPGLLADVCGDARVRVASRALGTACEAVNVWVGCGANVSTCHKDHYDNLYTVVTGAKRFTLLPPADVLWLYERSFRAATYAHDVAGCAAAIGDGGGRRCCWHVVPDGDSAPRVPWIAVDPEEPDAARFPLFAHASPVTIDVLPGETLYLPALWYHRVSHPRPDVVTIAVNSWRDMSYLSGTFATFALLHDLARLTTRTSVP